MPNNAKNDNSSVSTDFLPCAAVPTDASSPAAWRKRWKIYWKRPILYLALGWFLIIATASLLGLPRVTAWFCLMVGGAVILLAWMVMAGIGCWRLAKLELELTSKSNLLALGMVGMINLVIFLIIGAVTLIHWQQPPPQWTAVSMHSSHRSTTAEVETRLEEGTSRYWSVAVAALHRYRFGEVQFAGDDLPALAKRTKEFGEAWKVAREASTTSVDPDLVAMVGRHLQLDWEEFEMIAVLYKLQSEQSSTSPDAAAGTKYQSLEDWLAATSDEQIASLPLETQRHLARGLEILEERSLQLREIEIMQARLSERYPDGSFVLPNLDTEQMP